MFILDSDKLRIGDIILTTQDAVVSKTIRKATGSSFSHALLYVADHGYIHSDGDGVHSGNTQRLLFKDPGYSKVLRLKQWDQAVVESVCTYARTQIGKQYSVPEAIRSKVKRSESNKDFSNRQFCSRLVAQSYAFAQIRLVANPDYCYPQELDDSDLLDAVTGCVRVASEEDVEIAKSENPLELQTEVTNFILTQVRNLDGADIQTFEQLVPYLLANPQHDRAIVEIVRASGYLHLWRIDVDKNPWRYDGSIFHGLDIAPDEKVKHANRELASADKQLAQFTFMYSQYMMLWQRKPLAYFVLELNLYETLVAITERRVQAAKYVIGRS